MRYKLTISYKGTGFSGWQKQPNAITVEEELEKAFSQILQQPIDLVGQGRTDAGVHALGQVAHVDLPDSVNPDKLKFGVNGLTAEQIYVKEIEPVAADFHARFDAEWRSYEYLILKEPNPLKNDVAWYPGGTIDINTLLQCAGLFVGKHDFSGFSKYNAENHTTWCTVYESKFVEDEDIIRYQIKANRFLRNMVRRIAGTMMEHAMGKLALNQIRQILKAEKASAATHTAPAKGLVLKEVSYKKSEF